MTTSMKITTEELATLLKQAQQAHHEYEKKNTKPSEQDGNWAGWYATYIKEKLSKFDNCDENQEVHDEL